MQNDSDVTITDHTSLAAGFDEFFQRNASRLDDIFGTDIDDVMTSIGWHFAGGGVQLAMHRGDRFIGLAWALRTVDDHGHARINLTYAIDEAETGNGFATRLTAAAFLQAEATGVLAIDVSAQILIDNDASQCVALALGLEPDPALDFGCDTSSGHREYIGYSCSFESFSRMARERLSDQPEQRIRERQAA